MSGQQISAFALQIGDLPSHPSSTAAAAAAAAQLHACPRVPAVAKEMLREPRFKVCICPVCLEMSSSVYFMNEERKKKVYACILFC